MAAHGLPRLPRLRSRAVTITKHRMAKRARGKRARFARDDEPAPATVPLPIDDDALYSLSEAAARIHASVTPDHLRRAIYARKLAPTRIGKVTLIEGAELKRFVKASRCPPGATGKP